MADITRKRERDRLKARREPYWHRLSKGAYLGFRRGPDTWIARHRDREGKQHYKALEEATEYDDAKKLAERWLAQMGSTAVRSARRGTVRDALKTYLKHLRELGRGESADHAEARFKLTVWDDPLADLMLEALTREDMREWRERLREGRQPRSINRHVRGIVAGLNAALKQGFVGSSEAWKLEPLADDTDDGAETAVFLTPAQRRAIIAAAEPATAALLRALELTGARPSEIAESRARDFDSKAGTLRLAHKKGRPAKLRTRIVVLQSAAVEFFKAQSQSKLPAANLFLDRFGNPWSRYRWAKDVRAAVDAHNSKAKGKSRVPHESSAYSFRHARISELLQVHGVDPLTVALQTGTSIRMIERSYFKFIAPALREKLAVLEES